MGQMFSTLTSKLIIGFFILAALYFLLVYYKGGVGYIGAGSTAFDNGAKSILGAAKQGYAK